MSVKSWYLSVVDASTQKTVINKHFFSAPQMNKYIAEQEILEKYKRPDFYIVKENY